MAFNERILADRRPNFFELLAEESMHETFRPAVEYVCKVLARWRPRQLWRSRDEVHLLLESALQWCFLKQYDGSFSEHFYSLRRLPAILAEEEGRSRGVCGQLSLKLRCLSMLCLVVVPYLKVKMERLHSILTDQNDSTPITWVRGQGLRRLLKFVFFRTIPCFQSLWAALFFIFRFRYLMNRSQYYSPLHWAARVKIARQTEVLSVVTWSWLIQQLFSVSLFALRLLQWWYSGEREAAFRKMSSLPVPPPPPSSRPSSNGIPLTSDLWACPLCRRERRDPTALSTSGYVFCYGCVSDYITTHGQCPVTSLPSSHSQLIRLFLDHQ